MESPRELWQRLSRLWRRREQESTLDEEIRFHLEQQTEKNLRQGMSAAEARRDAQLRFGGIDRVKDSARDEIRPVLVDDLSRDVRYGVRTLLRAPGFALISLLTLGVGIGAATAMFTVVHGVLMKPLPYPEPERIVRLFQVDQAGARSGNVSEPNFEDWKAQSRSFQAMAEMSGPGQQSVVGASEPHRAAVTRVSREFFNVMGVQPAVGRGFRSHEQQRGAGATALVSYAYWRRWLGSNPSLSDMTLTFNQRVYTVIGVLPAGFDFPGATEIWYPRELDGPSPSRTAHNFQVVARLASGRSITAAQSELSGISRALQAQYGENENWMFDGAVVSLHEQLTNRVRPALLVLLAAAGFLLLIACANVSNLLLARSASRKRELAVRLALGAGQWRVARQFMAESLVLCGAGGLLGVGIAVLGVETLLAIEPGNLPRIREVSVNWLVLAFAILISSLTAIVLGLATTLRTNERELRGLLTDAQRSSSGSAGMQRARNALVVLQVALTLILLTGAGLLGRSFLRLLAVDPGYRTEGALVLDVVLPYAQNEDAAARQWRFQEELMDRLKRLPGVKEVGGINDFPMGGGFYANGTFLEMSHADQIRSREDVARLFPEEQARRRSAGFRIASGGYFRAMRIPLIRGRLFDESDTPNAPHVALISESLAKTEWPDQDPIGRFIQFGNMDGDLRGFRIIGIVGDVRELTPEAVPGPLFYGDYRQRPRAAGRFSIIISGTEASSVAAAAQRIVREMNPQLPVRTRTATDAFAETLAARRFSLLLLAIFAGTALLLATMGIYGVISYMVSQRTREIGIRMVLGANGGSVLRSVLARGVVLTLVGTVLGLGGALAMTRLVQRFLFGVSATDPVAFAGVVALILGATILATFIPAYRAMRLPPSMTLRPD